MSKRDKRPPDPPDDPAATTGVVPGRPANPRRTTPLRSTPVEPDEDADFDAPGPTLRVGAASDTGRVRQNNQDTSLVADDRLFAVADGMGGHKGGEVASGMAVAALRANFLDLSEDGLLEAANAANAAVYDAARDDADLAGMGTTLVAIARTDGPDLAFINVGDSRMYRLRNGELEQLTTDHSLVEELVREGQLAPEDARSHPQRNILTRALGIEASVAIDADTVTPEVGDRFLLCSDGLFNEVEEEKIASILRRYTDDPADAAQELVRLANEGGGRDNITVVIVDVVEPDPDDDDGGPARPAAVPATRAVDDPAGFTTAGPTTGPDTEVVPVVGTRTGRGGAITDTRAPTAAPLDRRERKAARKADRDAAKASRPRRFTWRVALFALLFLAVVGAGVGAVGLYARGSYFVGVDDAGAVTIFRGKPDPVLWFEPTVESATELTLADLRPEARSSVERGNEFATLEEAEDYLVDVGPAPTTTTTAPPTTAVPTTVAPPSPAPVVP